MEIKVKSSDNQSNSEIYGYTNGPIKGSSSLKDVKLIDCTPPSKKSNGFLIGKSINGINGGRKYSLNSCSFGSPGSTITTTTTVKSSSSSSSSTTGSSLYATPPRSSSLTASTAQLSQKCETPNRRFWGQEANIDSLYHIYLKKITYSSNSDQNESIYENIAAYNNLKSNSTPTGKTTTGNNSNSTDSKSKTNGYYLKSDSIKRRSDRKLKKDETLNGERITRVDQSEDRRRRSKSVDKSETQCLQWETRQVRILKAATLDHIIEYILLLTPHQRESKLSSTNHHCNPLMEEERNDVSHIMHVIFCTYRIYCSPQELFTILVKHSPRASPPQIRFVLHYWLTNYPEDFLTPLKYEQVSLEPNGTNGDSSDTNSNLSTTSSTTTNTTATSDTNGHQHDETLSTIDSVSVKSNKTSSTSSQLSESSPVTNNQSLLYDLLLTLPCIDDTLHRKAHLILKQCKSHSSDLNQINSHGNLPLSKPTSNCIIELDAKFVAQQLTAIDLENFLSLKAYTLLNGHRHNQRVQSMIKNFNLLSKHVIVTILKAHQPDLYATHWINIAQQLRKMKNFNSLKAVIAGLNNESVFRLKTTVWSKISKNTEATFKHLSTIVDDVDNQTLLRQTQLEIEGTAKVSIEEESFGTIPYLGTFLTDLTVIDTKLSNYIENPKEEGKKLVNLEKCCKQFEIVTQIHLLQKNINAALTAFHQSQQLSGLSQLPTYNSTPTVPRVARLFRTWFQDSNISDMTDNDCYKLSLALEVSQSHKK